MDLRERDSEVKANICPIQLQNALICRGNGEVMGVARIRGASGEKGAFTYVLTPSNMTEHAVRLGGVESGQFRRSTDVLEKVLRRLEASVL